MYKVAHFIHFPVSAKSFVEPIVQFLNESGIKTELCLEYHAKHRKIIDSIDTPKSFIPSDLTVNPIRLFKKLNGCFKYLKKNKIAIIHTHQTRASIIPLIAAFISRTPIRIYHNHGLPYLGYNRFMRSFLWSLEFINSKLATHVIFVSRSNLTEAIKDRILPAGKAHLLAHGSAVGIDLTDYRSDQFNAQAKMQARESFGIAPSAFVLSYVGRPVKRKGLHFLLESWKLSGLGEQGGILLIAGCTNAECTQALGEPVPGVKALGYLQDLKPFYAASDALTLPSQHEGFPYSLLEAAAAGLPLIGSDIPGIQCAIENNKTGLLIPFNDIEALSNAILKLAHDRHLRDYLGHNARHRVENQFDRTLVLDAVLQFYQKIL
jgi:N,N'-diacetylbacillosaminyl-diphospho-undecaprenol alpha-1,3-N-acetylgalactosaminyltransferase